MENKMFVELKVANSSGTYIETSLFNINHIQRVKRYTSTISAIYLSDNTEVFVMGSIYELKNTLNGGQKPENT